MEDITIDHFSGCQIIRPAKPIGFKYDFDFRKKGQKIWRYINSVNRIEEFNQQSQDVIEHGGEYRIVEAATNQVVRRG